MYFVVRGWAETLEVLSVAQRTRLRSFFPAGTVVVTEKVLAVPEDETRATAGASAAEPSAKEAVALRPSSGMPVSSSTVTSTLAFESESAT